MVVIIRTGPVSAVAARVALVIGVVRVTLVGMVIVGGLIVHLVLYEFNY